MANLDMDVKVTVVNLAPWNVAFPNRARGGDTCFAPSSKVRVRRDELEAQVSAGNKLLNGIDGAGSHATLYIDDDETRRYFEFDSEDGKTKQNVITDEKILKWFELKTMSAFEKNIRENVITMAEKRYVINAIKRLKLDSYEKISFCQEYCKFKLY